MPLDLSFIIPGQLAGMAKPGGPGSYLQADLARLREQGIGALVSLTLEPPDQAAIQAAGLELLHLPVPDFAAPADEWRMTMMSACSAWRFSAVSLSVSPLVMLEAVAMMLTTSAESRWAANSKLVRVRVLGSMKRFTIVLPRSAGTFFTSRWPTSSNVRAVSRMWTISSGWRS